MKILKFSTGQGPMQVRQCPTPLYVLNPHVMAVATILLGLAFVALFGWLLSTGSYVKGFEYYALPKIVVAAFAIGVGVRSLWQHRLCITT